MRIAVTGGRMFGRVPDDVPPEKLAAARAKAAAERARVFEALEIIHSLVTIEEVIHGDASGADRLGAEWASRRRVSLSAYPADWKNIDLPGARIRFGKYGAYDATAGFRRNMKMLIEGAPELVVAFPGGAGTAHMTGNALRRDIAVLSVDG